MIGIAGERRLASEAEKTAYDARVKPFRSLRGYKPLWSDLNYVREIKLQSAEPVLYPRMMDDLCR